MSFSCSRKRAKGRINNDWFFFRFTLNEKLSHERTQQCSAARLDFSFKILNSFFFGIKTLTRFEQNDVAIRKENGSVYSKNAIKRRRK